MRRGRSLATRDVAVDRAAIDAVLVRFRGPILQVPPMHSALKRDGQPLYAYARRGIEVERAPRPVTIHRLEAVGFDDPSLLIEVDCSKGTYVRTLAEDIGAALGCGGHLTALRRTRVGDVTLADAIALDAFEALDESERERCLLPVDTLIARAAAHRSRRRSARDASPTGSASPWLDGDASRARARVSSRGTDDAAARCCSAPDTSATTSASRPFAWSRDADGCRPIADIVQRFCCGCTVILAGCARMRRTPVTRRASIPASS